MTFSNDVKAFSLGPSMPRSSRPAARLTPSMAALAYSG